jgi:hypothetical protein
MLPSAYNVDFRPRPGEDPRDVQGLNGIRSELRPMARYVELFGDCEFEADDALFVAALGGKPIPCLERFSPVGRLTDDDFARYHSALQRIVVKLNGDDALRRSGQFFDVSGHKLVYVGETFDNERIMMIDVLVYRDGKSHGKHIRCAFDRDIVGCRVVGSVSSDQLAFSFNDPHLVKNVRIFTEANVPIGKFPNSYWRSDDEENIVLSPLNVIAKPADALLRLLSYLNKGDPSDFTFGFKSSQKIDRAPIDAIKQSADSDIKTIAPNATSALKSFSVWERGSEFRVIAELAVAIPQDVAHQMTVYIAVAGNGTRKLVASKFE